MTFSSSARQFGANWPGAVSTQLVRVVARRAVPARWSCLSASLVQRTPAGRTVQIRVFSATATGPTAVVAFDRALRAGGAHDQNVIRLSSIVLAHAHVVRAAVPPAAAGGRLYSVLIDQRCEQPGREAWAGLAWAVDRSGRGGIFVEAAGSAEEMVRAELEVSIEALLADRPYWDAAPHECEVVGVVCIDDPVCALVMAAYAIEPWPSRTPPPNGD